MTIQVFPKAGASAQTIADQLPAGWNVSGVSDSGSFDEVNRKVKWGPFFDDLNRSLTYTVTPPATASGSTRFAGNFSIDGLNIPVTGQRETTSRTITPTPIILLSGDLGFGNVNVGSSVARTLTIGNTGNSSLTVSGISYPSGFSGDWSGGTIPPGGSQIVTVTFSPTSAIGYNGNLMVNSDKTSGIETLAVSGTGTSMPTIDITPKTLTFSGAEGGTGLSSQTVSVSNIGGSTLNWSASVTIGPFITLVGATAGGNSGTFRVFATVGGLPAGIYKGNIRISSSDTSITPQDIPVTLIVGSQTTVVTPTINPNGGSFTDSVQVRLDCATVGATIHYTLNGDEPTASSTVYGAPFTLINSSTVKAKAFKAGSSDSGVTKAGFTIGPRPKVAASHQSDPIYDSPGVFTVNGRFSYPSDSQLLSLRWQPKLPSGWTLLSVSGDGGPEVHQGEFVFIGKLTANPINFSFAVTVPPAQTGTKEIAGLSEYQLSGMVNPATLQVTSDPPLLNPVQYHSADYRDTRWVVDGTEISRVLSYWRAQKHSVNSAGADGYAAGPGDTGGRKHSADYREPYWTIDGSEISRVLSYWRAEAYHADVAGLDGFAPGAPAARVSVSDLRPRVTASTLSSITQSGPPNYTAGGNVQITTRFNYSGTLLSLLLRPQLPSGWKLSSATANGTVEVQGGEILLLGNLPPSPVEVVMTMQVPAGQSGVKNVRTQVEHQFSGDVNPSSAFATPDPLAISDIGPLRPQVITFNQPANRMFGEPPFALTASSSSGLPVLFDVVAGPANLTGNNTLTLSGAGSVTVKATQPGNAGWLSATPVERNFAVAKATPSVIWADPAPITYGVGLSDIQLNASANVPGAFAYVPSAQAVLSAGSQKLSAVFTPKDADNYALANANATIVVKKAAVKISADPKTKPFNTPLPELTFTPFGLVNKDEASVIKGIQLVTAANQSSPAGNYEIGFAAGASAANYDLSFVKSLLKVTKAKPIIVWPAPSDIAQGTALSDAQLNAASAVKGSFVYAPTKGTVLPLGRGQELRVVFLPTDAANYESGQATNRINVINPNGNRWDLNGDGKSDVLFQHVEGYLAAWYMDGAARALGVLLTPASVGDPRWRVVGYGDFNGDGKGDLLFQYKGGDFDGTLAIWFMDGVALVEAKLALPNNPGPGWTAIAVGDFNGDGKGDVLFQHDDGFLATWYMDGATRREAKLLNPIAPLGADGKVDVSWRAVAAADLNGDQKFDVIFQYAGGAFDRTVAVWYLDGNNQIGAALLEPANPGSGWSIAGSADYNKDGKADLLFQHASGLIGVWYLDGVKLKRGELLNPETPGEGWRVVGP